MRNTPRKKIKKNLKIKKMIILIVLLTNFLFAKSNIVYVSPGIGIDWNLKAKISIKPKISIGYNDIDKFINFTIGKNYGDENYYFIEPQIGTNYKMLFYGGGVGLNIGKDKLEPKFSCFAGSILFLNCTITLTSNNQNLIKIGIKGVLPIPIDKKKVYIGCCDLR